MGLASSRMAAVVALALLPLASVQAAQPPADPRGRAMALFEQSEKLYRQGSYQEAAAMLREAHALVAEPVLLYNLGRALEGAGDLAGAVAAYSEFLSADPSARDRPSLEQKIARLRERIEQKKPETPGAVVASDDTPRSRAGPWVLGAAGAATVVAGVAMGSLAARRRTQAADDPVQRSADHSMAEGRRFALAANLLYVGGGLLLGGAALWAVLTLPKKAEDKPMASSAGQVDLLIGPGSVGLRGGFP